MTPTPKEILAKETDNIISAELKMQALYLQYQAALIDCAEQSVLEHIRMQIHALTDICIDAVGIQVQCIKLMQKDGGLTKD